MTSDGDHGGPRAPMISTGKRLVYRRPLLSTIRVQGGTGGKLLNIWEGIKTNPGSATYGNTHS